MTSSSTNRRKDWLVGRASPEEFDNQRERLAAAQAEKAEMENLVRRGELAVTGDVVAELQDHISAARSKMLGIPAGLAPQIVGINDPNVIASAMRAAITAALSELAEYQPAKAAP